MGKEFFVCIRRVLLGLLAAMSLGGEVGAENLWELEIPLETKWRINIAIEEHNELGFFTGIDTRVDLSGEFALIGLPPEKKFSDFIKKKYPEPYGDNPTPYRIWFEKLLTEGYSGITGKVSGTFTWTELLYQYSNSIMTLIDYGLPTQVYPIEGVVIGGSWPDGLRLFIYPSGTSISDIFSLYKAFNRKAKQKIIWYDGRITEEKVDRHEEFGNYMLPPYNELTFQSPLALTDQTQTFLEPWFPGAYRRTTVTITPDCPVENSRFDVVVARDTPPWTPDNTLDSNEIADLRAQKTGKAVPPGANQLGWTHPDIPPVKPMVEIEWDQKPHNDSTQICLFVDRINVFQKLAMSMYIADKYPPASCPYNALYGHEKKHSDCFFESTDSFLDTLRMALLESPEIPSRARPFRVPKSAAGNIQQAVGQNIHNIVWPKFVEMLEAFKKKCGDGIDTQAEYDKVRAQCQSTDWD